MNELEKRFGWRLEIIKDLLKKSYYKKAFVEYSNLVRLFKRLEGYDEWQKINFYKKIKYVGDNLLVKLSKKKSLSKIKGIKFSKKEFNKKLKDLNKDNFNGHVCDLIKKENFEGALKFYENK